MRRAHDRASGMQENQAGQQAGATSSGPGTSAGAAATGGRETEQPYTTGTGTYGTGYERGMQQPTYGPAAQGPGGGYGRTSMETGTSTVQGGMFLVLAGLLTFLVGLAFVVRHSFYHSISAYAYNWGIVSWGWVLFGLGIATFAVGACHLLGIPFSRWVGVTMAVLTAVAGFMIIPFYPLWGIVIVALGLAALWGLLHGAENREAERREYERSEYERQRMMR